VRPPVGSHANAPLLEVHGLTVRLGPIAAVSSVSFKLAHGQFMGIVGESGAGKSVAARAMLGLLPPYAEIDGSIRFQGKELVGASEKELRRIRGAKIGFVFQDALTALDPVRTIGAQLVEALRAAKPETSRVQARAAARDLLDEVKLSDPARTMESYPHQLSGGMRQRVAIAIALIADPVLVIADEPTSALDVTVQRRVLELLVQMCGERDAAVVLITHDMGVVAETCDRVAVMYGGLLVEEADVFELFDEPRNPYTRALLDALPKVGDPGSLRPIPGQAAQVIGTLTSCPFAPRCRHVTTECRDNVPPEVAYADRSVRCFHAGVPAS